MVLFVCSPVRVGAVDDVQTLQENLQSAADQKRQLEAEIAKNQEDLDRVVGEKQTLSKAVSSLTYSENKITGDIKNTEKEIVQTQQQILTLSQQIDVLSESIDDNQNFIQATLREVNKESDTGLWEALLLYDTFSDFLGRAGDLARTGDVLRENLMTLGERRNQLLVTNNQKALAKYSLETQKESLDDQKQIVAYAKQQKAQLLKETKNQEQNYQQSLAEKQAAVREFEESILQLESQLKIALDKDAIQEKLAGLFSWPFSGWYRITQFFGNTSYATSGAYNGRGHSGTDFAAPIGTPVLAMMDGVVMAADDTGESGYRDAKGRYHQCISYGKWIVIDHENGLSTRVNHLSLIKVKDGQAVRRGDIIGYTGNTGISTGPHLHVSVMATQGVQIRKLGDVITTQACRDARAPITASNAYLDPFDYLPRPQYTLKPVAFGDSGSDVQALQMVLKHERIFPIEVSANGVYGPTTAKAVLEWQKKYRVNTDSILEQKAGKIFGKDSVAVYDRLF